MDLGMWAALNVSKTALRDEPSSFLVTAREVKVSHR